MGANPHAGGCTFRVWAPNASAVHVAFLSEDWAKGNHPMSREPGNGAYWSCDVDVDVHGSPVGPGAEYQYVIDNKDGKPAGAGGENWRPDAYSRDVNDTDAVTNDPEDVSSLVVDPRNDWGPGRQWTPFGTPRFDDLVLYQVHTGSFAGLNDGLPAPGRTATFDTVSAKLDYVRGLGFNALALLPLGEFRGTAGLGYAPTNWFAPETAYGSPASLRRFVDLAHSKGLAVLFDVVYNHGATEGNRLWNYDGQDRDGGIYFEDGGDSEFGHRPAHWKLDVKNFFLDNARMWLDEYRGDGLRFDVAHGIARDSLKHVIGNLRLNPFWRDKYFVAEWTGDDRGAWPGVVYDLGFNAVWEMDSAFAFRRAVGGDDPVGNMEKVITLGFGNHWNKVLYLLGSHDNIRDGQSGNDRTGGVHLYPAQYFGGRGNWHGRAQCRMGWALTAASPGVPMMFMGCEGHHHGYWWPNADRNPAHDDHRFDWSIVGDSVGAPMQRMVRDANNARWNNPALRTHTLDFTHRDRDNGVLAFKRWNDSGNVVLVVAHFGERQWQNRDYGVETRTPGRWEEIFNSQSPEYGGYENSGNFGHRPWTQADGKIYVNLPKWSVQIWRKVE
jgi:1,4-alpha-glucan branching enzyme